MADTLFIPEETRIRSTWLNEVNELRHGNGSAARGSGVLEYVPFGTDATPRTVQTELDNHIVGWDRFMSEAQRNDGLSGAGLTDIHAPVQKVIDYAMTHQLTISGLPGRWLHGDTFTISSDGVFIEGTGQNMSVIRNGDFGPSFLFTGNDATGVTVNNCGLRNMLIQANGLMSTDALVMLNGVFLFYMDNVRLGNPFTGIHFRGVRRAWINNPEVAWSSIFGGVATGRCGYLFDSAAATYAHPSCAAVFMDGYNVQGPSAAGALYDYGMLVKSGDGIWCSNGHLGVAGIANLCLSAEIAGALEFINHFYMEHTEIDSVAAGSVGIQVKGNTNQIFSCRISNTTLHGGSSGHSGLLVDAGTDVDGMEFCNVTAFNFDREGAKLLGGRDFIFNGWNSKGNSKEATNGFSGIYMENVQGASFNGGQSGKDPFGSIETLSQKFGIDFGAGNTDVLLNGIDLTGNVSGSLNGGAGQYRWAGGLLDKTPALAVTENLVVMGGKHFNGTTDYVDTMPLTGVADGKKGIFVAKLRFDKAVGPTTLERLIGMNTNNLQIHRVQTGGGANAALTVVARNTAAAIILSQALPVQLEEAGIYTIMCSWDLAVPDSMRMYVDDATDTITSNTFTNDTIDYTPGEYSVGADAGGANFFDGDFYMVYLNTAEYLDFDVAANRRKFFDRTGNMVSLGVHGEAPTGNVPILYFGGSDYNSWPINRGSGTGGNVVNGTPAAVTVDDYGYKDVTLRSITVTAATHAIGRTIESLIADRAGGTVTVTMPSAATYPGRKLRFRTVQNQAVVSASNNVVPINSLVPGNAILPATAGKWVDTESDGTNWQITAGN